MTKQVCERLNKRWDEDGMEEATSVLLFWTLPAIHLSVSSISRLFGQTPHNQSLTWMTPWTFDPQASVPSPTPRHPSCRAIHQFPHWDKGQCAPLRCFACFSDLLLLTFFFHATGYTGGKPLFTHWVHGEYIVGSETEYPAWTHQVHLDYICHLPPICPPKYPLGTCWVFSKSTQHRTHQGWFWFTPGFILINLTIHSPKYPLGTCWVFLQSTHPDTHRSTDWIQLWVHWGFV